MHNRSPIRRYVLLRQRNDDSPATRWSLERIGAAPCETDRAPRAAQRPAPRVRG